MAAAEVAGVSAAEGAAAATRVEEEADTMVEMEEGAEDITEAVEVEV